MTPAHELAQFLADEGIGTFAADAGWSVNVSRMPDGPDTAICLYDRGGPEPLSYDIELREPAVEVRIRGTDYEAMHAQFQAIFDLLTEPGDSIPESRTIGGGLYLGIWLESELIDLGRDDNDRFRISGNYRCNRQPAETNS